MVQAPAVGATTVVVVLDRDVDPSAWNPNLWWTGNGMEVINGVLIHDYDPVSHAFLLDWDGEWTEGQPWQVDAPMPGLVVPQTGPFTIAEAIP